MLPTWAAAAIVVPAVIGLGVWIGLVARNARIDKACEDCHVTDD